ncbi:O-antigen ligase family protein [Denitratisoma oestradiolicum]|uniref:O-antigen ligase-related domain-containing protein n=1 Tax=Denitratisoma oestradiolicum TaxID=311182 RepID=A0A6S6Y1F5_9PROT|nr:O-antigen ligase family protein [Denitratisoma oestradiolicum]TWO79307.1 hypothetical protein CBW56_15475 [Denitratisoma oestradiolicum]CAB1370365.1 membrane protein of unknown function [Denitratisoma oestradiolicum]
MVREQHSILRWGGVALFIHFVSLPLGHMAALRSASLLGVLVAAALAWSRLPPRRPGPMAALFAVWLALALASVAWSVEPAYTLEAALTDVPRSALLFWAGHTLARGGLSWRIAAWAGTVFLLICAPLAALAPRNSMGIWEAGWLPASGDYATAALIFLPVVGAALCIRGRQAGERLFLLAGLAAGFYGGYLCASRIFWLVLLVIVTVAAGYGLSRPGVWRRYGLPVMAGLAAMIVVVLALAGLAARQRDLPLLHTADRVRLYSGVVEKLEQGPALGVGYGKETHAAWYLQTFPDLPEVRHPHNIVLSFADQLGWPGLLLLAALFGVPAWRLVSQGGGGDQKILVATGLALLAGVFVKNSTDLFFYKQHLWLLFGLLGLWLGTLERGAGALSVSALRPASPRRSVPGRRP